MSRTLPVPAHCPRPRDHVDKQPRSRLSDAVGRSSGKGASKPPAILIFPYIKPRSVLPPCSARTGLTNPVPALATTARSPVLRCTSKDAIWRRGNPPSAFNHCGWCRQAQARQRIAPNTTSPWPMIGSAIISKFELSAGYDVQGSGVRRTPRQTERARGLPVLKRLTTRFRFGDRGARRTFRAPRQATQNLSLVKALSRAKRGGKIKPRVSDFACLTPGFVHRAC
ncbi:hypothetical protein SAMN05216551_102180 [Chitinasiproducens palmae]|uniref:Uncharacterized protein n=1 Tax=Chitinasiproducens palmae TaxID=1770053 RepID=A0A1H2PKP2_9BURK|nr:hypothetical protein SAMN05216551_102180 [Chitinasiproducens palmae]